MARPLSVAIVGAGMGGLATAAALRRVGIDAMVYEQASQFARIGAGIQIGCNAMKVLRVLGLEARPLVLVGPVAQTLPAYLASAQAVIVAGPEAPPGAGWTRTFKGEVLSVFRPAAAPP